MAPGDLQEAHFRQMTNVGNLTNKQKPTIRGWCVAPKKMLILGDGLLLGFPHDSFENYFHV